MSWRQAKKLGLPVKLHDEQADRIFPDTLMIDDRVTDELRQARARPQAGLRKDGTYERHLFKTRRGL